MNRFRAWNHLRPASGALRLLTMTIVGVTVALGFVLLDRHATFAECPSLDPWPSFTAAAPSAQRIIVGTVTSTAGGTFNNDFTLRVDRVLRGEAADEIHFLQFKSGMPLVVCPVDSTLTARLGDRIAIAYSARLAGVTRRITAVAFLNPINETVRFLMPKVEVLSEAKVVALAGLPPTDVASSNDVGQDPGPGSSGLPLLLLAAAAAAAAALQRRRALAPPVRMGSEAP